MCFVGTLVLFWSNDEFACCRCLLTLILLCVFVLVCFDCLPACGDLMFVLRLCCLFGYLVLEFRFLFVLIWCLGTVYCWFELSWFVYFGLFCFLWLIGLCLLVCLFAEVWIYGFALLLLCFDCLLGC